MSIKTKLTSLITTFVLLYSLLTVGVFAVKNTTFNVGGDIVFNVQGIEATITRGATAGFTADKTIGNAEGNILSDITLNNDMTAEDVADAFAPWSGLNLAFSENVATIKLTIKNEAEEGADNYLDITALASATTKNNARVSVVNDAGGVTALLQPQQSASFTITFSVIDDEYSATLEGFSVNFDMQKKVLADFPKVESIEDQEDLLDQYEFSEFSTSAPYTVAIGAKGASEFNYTTTLSGDIVVPSYVNKDGIVYAVTQLSRNAFGCSQEHITFDYQSLTLPKTLKVINSFSIYTTNSMKIEIPYGVTKIDTCALDGSIGISEVKIPDTVSTIEQNAFSGCESLTTIVIPNSVTSIGEYAFSGCIGLTSITVDDGNSVYDSRNNCNAIIETAINTLIQGCQNTTISDSIVSIGEGAFYCIKVEDIYIPYGVKSIGVNAFAFTDFKNIEIPVTVTTMGYEAFYAMHDIGCTINYHGTQEQWEAIVGLEDASIPLNATINYNYTGA